MATIKMQQLLSSRDTNPPIEYIPDFLTPSQALELYNHCETLAWRQNKIKIIGKTIPVPRLECMYGDEGCDYVYSKSVLLQPIAWTPELQQLRLHIESSTGYRFHIVLCNRYRDGRDSNGWHADNEKSMGKSPAIASITLGQKRKFQMRQGKKGKPVDIWLEHGSLLVMHPGCQESWVHQLPKTTQPVEERINLTFRPHVKGKLATDVTDG